MATKKGLNMKYIKDISLLFFCVFIMFFINSCVDPTVTTEIEVINKSSYDLHISFIAVDDLFWNKEDYIDIEVMQNQSASFTLHTGMGSHHAYRDPNDEVEKIIFKDLKTNDTINELENKNTGDLFKLIDIDEGWHGGKDVYFLFEIDDDLLGGLYGNNT